MEVNIVLNPNKLAGDKKNVSIRFTDNRITNYINLGIKVKPSNFKNGRFKNDFLEENEFLQKEFLKAEKIIIKMIDEGLKGFQEFKRLWDGEKPQLIKTPSFYEYGESLELILRNKGKIGNADVYKATLRRLKKHYDNLEFSEITMNFLEDLHEKMTDEGRAGNYQSIVFRTMSIIFNKAVGAKVVDYSIYPFKNTINPRGFCCTSMETKTKKRTLTDKELSAIKDFTSDDANLMFAKDIFIFSYYASGMNITDIANLKETSLFDDRVYYIRAKTGKEYNLKVSEQMNSIIQKYRGHHLPYLFPILKPEFSNPQQIKDRMHKVTAQINGNLKKIAQDLNINKPLSTYWARHTLATRLYHNNVNIGVISQVLGHSDIKTTQIYLEGFSNNVVDKILEDLL